MNPQPSNVIDFNTARSNLALNKMIDNKQNEIAEETFINGTAVCMSQDIVDALLELGYDPYNNPDAVKEIYGIIENIKGYMYRCLKGKHFIHGINNSIFTVETDPEEVLDNFFELE